MQALPTQLFTVGLTCLFGSILIFWVFVPAIVDWQITKFIKLEEGNEIWEGWTEIDAKLYFKVYLFNVTNPDEISSGGSPKLEEIGPYVYEEERSNLVKSNNPENNTVRFQPTILFHFRPDLSNGLSEDDVITMLNVPVVAIGHELNTWSRMIRYMAKYYLKNFKETLFVQRTVKLALFEGVHVEMIESISNLLGREYLPNNTFGLVSEKNGTLPFDYEIISGVQDNTKFADIVTYNGQKELSIWNGDSCNMINGSDGTLFPPFVKKDTVLQAFVPDICRSVKLEYEREEEYNGVKGYRFQIPKDYFNADYPGNECFCMEEDKADCPKSGALSIAPCKWGAPLSISFPHFLHADPIYLEQSGISPPKPELHESYAIIEPHTGVALKGSTKLQFNIQIKPSSHIPELYNVREMMMPLFWIEEEASQSQKQFDLLDSRLVIPLLAVEIGKWSLLSLSSIITTIGVIIFMTKSKKKHVEYSGLALRF